MKSYYEQIHSDNHRTRRLVDENEAPEGFRAISKDYFKDSEGRCQNFCQICDFRPQCKLTTSTPCMSGENVNGGRKDKCSVIFKKK